LYIGSPLPNPPRDQRDATSGTRSIDMSILTHFTLNAMHFLLFTYPRTA
jgi:hypothetical protein